MPFGAIYGALFFVLIALWMTLLIPGERELVLQLIAGSIGLVALAVGLGLLLRRGWARWGGAALSVSVVVLLMTVLGVRGVGGLVLLFGSVVAVVLLVLPATGDVTRGLSGKASAPGLARVLAGGAALGGCGLLAALGFLVTVPASPESRTAADGPVQVAGLSPRVRWSDFGAGLERARAEDKPMVVTFQTSWCGYCKKMDRTTWKHPQVVERLGQLVAVKVDGDAEQELTARYGVSGYPAVLLVGPGGEVISRTGGYQDPRQLLGWLEDGLGRLGPSNSPPLRRVRGS